MSKQCNVQKYVILPVKNKQVHKLLSSVISQCPSLLLGMNVNYYHLDFGCSSK